MLRLRYKGPFTGLPGLPTRRAEKSRKRQKFSSRTLHRLVAQCSVATGGHWTGSPNKSIDQIRKNCPKNVRQLCFRPLTTIFGHCSDIFSTFCGHFVDTLFFWAVQRFACYKCSARPAAVAATPPCSATPFQTQIRCDTF